MLLFTIHSVFQAGVCSDTEVYGASKMVDGSDTTWWQSMSRNLLVARGNGAGGVPQATVTLNMLEVNHIKKLC